ncbi:MAG: glycosyltransferase family 39 protein [Alphaproteobacteria bacterium]|nr:glycosyltransferase family 39 protein [Alphaproteobacteria bacterium]
MSSPPPPPPPLSRDRVLWWAVAVGLYLRGYALARWPRVPCVRDECTYLALAERMLDGQGIQPAEKGWLWAPGYPALLAGHERWLGEATDIRVTQILLSGVMIAFAYRLARDAAGPELGQRAGRWAAWLFALSPTLAFFSLSLWSESLYLTLLLGALVALGWAREGGPARGLLPGALVGLCVLFRGVATYMLPIFALGLVWQRWRQARAWSGAAALALGAALVVTPYATHASGKWEGRVVSDRTLGQMMWLGNNDFPPVTFDYGNGALTPIDYAAATAGGRPHCEFTGDPTAWDACETENGLAWIRANPGRFLRRVPLRLAQLLNPNSFLTRHLRWDRWKGISEGASGGLISLTLLWSALAIVGGTLGLAARGRSWRAAVVSGILLYHLAAIGILAGLTRYRVPLDGLWLIYAAGLLAAPRESLRALTTTPWRLAAGGLTLAVLVPLSLHFLSLAWS